MSLFRDLFGRRDAAPAWASSFESAARVREFVAVVERDLRRRGLRFQIVDGVVKLDGEPLQAGLPLTNIAQACRRASVTERERLVARHFDGLLAAPGEARALLADKPDLARVGSMLRLRLYEAGSLPPAPPVVTRVIADDLVAALVYDLPDAIQFVREDEAAAWSVDREELFSRAAEQTADCEVPSAEMVTMGTAQVLCLVGGPYTATHALFVEAYFDEIGRHGTLVACPVRGRVFAHAIHDDTLIEAIRGMTAVAHGLFEEEPYPVTRSVYWRRDGHTERLDCTSRGGKVTFAPTPEFEDVMSALRRN